MTIKELAEIAGVSQETIRRYGKQHFPSFHTNGVKVNYEDVSKIIMTEVKKKNMVSLNSKPTQIVEQPSQNVEVIQMFKMMFEQNQQFMSSMMDRMDKLENKQPKQLSLPVAPDIEPRAYLNQLVREYSQLKGVDFRKGWNVLYTELLYRCKTNIKVKSKNEGIKPIDYLERENMLLTACSIMKGLI